MNKEIIVYINIVHFILTIEQLIAVFNVDMNNVVITHRVLSTRLIATLINAGIEKIDLFMCAVTYAVATVLLSFIKIGVHKLVLLTNQKYYFIINNLLYLLHNFCFSHSYLSNVVNIKKTFQ